MTDLIVHNARIRGRIDVDEFGHEVLEETLQSAALAVSDGVITSVGPDEEILELADDTTAIVDAEGGTLLPGLIDSHSHPTWGAELTIGVDLAGLDLDGVRAALRGASAKAPVGSWIRAWNLDYKVFAHDPIHRTTIDASTGDVPAVLVFYDLHTGLVNSAGVDAAGLTGREEFADSSLVVIDDAGVPTGELREIPAYTLALDAAGPLPLQEVARRTHRILSDMAATGLTSVAVMDGRDLTIDTLRVIEDAYPTGLPLRVHVALWHQPGDDDAAVEERISRLGEHGQRWCIDRIKIFLDGVIDTGTAWLHEADSSGGSTHAFWKSVDRYREVVARYHAAGFQIATHSCGDAGVAEIARTYAALDGPSSSGAPHRIEHLETLTDADVSLVGENGICASMQPLHMQWREGDGSDSWATRLGPDRAAHAFRIRDLRASGAPIALGSDWPVAQYDPRLGMAWARLRRLPGDASAPVFEPNQRLTGAEAVAGYTSWAADALGRPELGALGVGTPADFVLFADDPAEADPDALLDLDVRLTVVDGHVVHDNTGTTTLHH